MSFHTKIEKSSTNLVPSGKLRDIENMFRLRREHVPFLCDFTARGNS